MLRNHKTISFIRCVALVFVSVFSSLIFEVVVGVVASYGISPFASGVYLDFSFRELVSISSVIMLLMTLTGHFLTTVGVFTAKVMIRVSSFVLSMVNACLFVLAVGFWSLTAWDIAWAWTSAICLVGFATIFITNFSILSLFDRAQR